MRSVRSRLSIGLAVFLAVLLLGQWLWLAFTIDRLIEKQVITRLQEETETLLAHVHIQSDGEIVLDSRRLSSSYQRAFSGLYFSIQTTEHQLFSRSLWDFDLTTPAISIGTKATLYLEGPGEQPLMAVSAGYLKQGKQLTITVAEDIAWMLEDKSHFQWTFAVLSLIGVLSLLAFQFWIVRLALKPLNKAKNELKLLGHGEIEKIDEQAPDEIRPLLVELNRLMSSMVIKTRRSRQSLGNLAHRLKTQLTLLNQIADIESMQQSDDARQAIYTQTNEIRQIIDRELKRARVSGITLPGKGVDISEMVENLTDTLKRIYQDKALDFSCNVDKQLRFHGDREDLLELLGNILDNACKWCDSRIELNIYSDNGIRICVKDDGPGCHGDDLAALTQRGFRADETTPGSGLGLAIVFDIVESYDGSMHFSESPKWGGLQVDIHLQSSVST